MKRNVKSVFKLLVLSGSTVLCTVFLFRLIANNNAGQTLNHGPMPRPPSKTNNNGEAQMLQMDNTKIDWHNYTLINLEKKRTGTGEQGVPAHLGSKESDNYDGLYKVNGFNAALSDKISVDRAIPDIRHKGCASKKYLKQLGTVSVIVPFHNEHWTTLLRTVHSIVNRSPPELLKEIILVDDCSTKDFSKKPLDDYMRANMTKVQIIHLEERQGLIIARLAGARKATGDVLIFLDSHSEANVNWLPPLLEPIAMDYKTCVCPFIDVIAYETFEYRSQDEGARGAFDWELFYKRLPLLPEDLSHPTEPFKSPIMAGGLFAISSKFFWELDGYDEGLQIWGGEQYELSFKIWMCGGQMLDAPCSRVGHIYRKYSPFPNPGRGDYVGKNYRRVAEVWMDEYAQYLYKRRPHYKDIDPGDISKQKALREKLKCKSFKWFIQEIAFDLPLKYPPVEPEDFASGEIRSIAAPELCVHLDSENRDQVVNLQECAANYNKHQEFKLSWHKDVRPSKSTLCWDVSDPRTKADIVLYPCHGGKGNQYFKYDAEKQILNFGENGSRCVDCDPGAKKLYVTKCDSSSKTQLWRFKHVNLKAIGNWDSINNN